MTENELRLMKEEYKKIKQRAIEAYNELDYISPELKRELNETSDYIEGMLDKIGQDIYNAYVQSREYGRMNLYGGYDTVQNPLNEISKFIAYQELKDQGVPKVGEKKLEHTSTLEQLDDIRDEAQNLLNRFGGDSENLKELFKDGRDGLRDLGKEGKRLDRAIRRGAYKTA